jgi:diadenosine tetraphosphate (Ap4A) HIT family hydrolase
MPFARQLTWPTFTSLTMSTFIIPEETRSSKRPVEIGPAPYYHQSDCKICLMQDGQFPPLVGEHVVEGKWFVAQHAPLKQSNAGTVLVVARRHLLDFGEMTPAESAELGAILRRLVPALKAATGAHRVYFLALMERVAHFHLWLVPKKKGGRLKGVAYLARRPVPASKRAARAIVRKIRNELDRS